MGTVYKAEHVLLKHIIAVKILRAHIAQDEEYLLRFQREARTACRIKHPNAITLHDFGVEDGAPYLVMEYIEGRTLKQIIKEQAPLPFDRCHKIAIQTAAALCEAHSYGIVHRDLKPENIMISVKRDGSEWAHVLDFGIAKVLTPDNEQDLLTQTRTGAIFGSPKYMAPEQALSQPIDARTDIYALGVVLYEMLTSTVPFAGSNTVEVMYKICHESPKPMNTVRPELHIPEVWNRMVMKMLARDPAERYQSLKEFLDECSAFYTKSAGASRPTWATMTMLGVTAAALVAVVVLSVTRGREGDSSPERLQKLEALQQQKEAELLEAARLAEEKKKEVEVAAAEAERLKQQQEQLKKLTEEQKVLALEASRQAEEYRQLRIKEEERASALKLQAEQAEKVAAAQKDEAERAVQAAALQKREAEEAASRLQREAALASKAEEERVLALRTQAEQAAQEAEQKRLQAEQAAAEASKQKGEAAAAMAQAEEERKKAEAKQQAAEALSLQAKTQMQPPAQSVSPDPTTKLTTPPQAALEQAYSEAEQKRLKALEEAKLLERRQREAEEKLRALQQQQRAEAERLRRLREAEQAKATTTVPAVTPPEPGGDEPVMDDSARKKPRQGKKR